MARGYAGFVAKTLGAVEHELTVDSIRDVTPHYRRITFHAPTLFDGDPIEPAAWIRMWAPDPDRPGREHQRGYTLVDPDPVAKRVSLEFVLHDPAGPAGTWARGAGPGDAIQVTRWSSTHFTVPDPAPDGYLLIGDAASLPGINAILEAIPETAPVVVYLEQYRDDDPEIPITPHSRAEVTWVRTTGDPAALANAIGARDWSNWYAWVTAESAATRHVRARLTEFGFPKTDVKSQAYWAKGKAMGRDRERRPAHRRPQPPSRDAAPVHRRQWRSTAGARLLAPLKAKLIIAGAVQAVVSLLQLAPYLLLIELCRRLLAEGAGTAGLTELGVAALVLLGAATALAGALATAMHVMDARFGHEVRKAVVGKLARLPLGWFTERTSGKIKNAVQDDAASVHYLVTHAVLDVVAALVTPLAVLAYLFTVSAGLTVILLVPLVVFAVLTARMVQASSSALARFTAWEERVAAEAVAHVDGLAVTRVYDGGPASGLRATLAERARFLDGWQRPLSGRKTLIDLVTRPLTMLLLIVAAGGALVAGGLLTAAEVLPFLLLGTTYGSQLLAVAYGMRSVRESRAAARRIGLLLEESELPIPEEAALPQGGRTVRFENVSYGFAPGREVLSGIDLMLSPGTVTALVGPSGAGKSTLAALLARFHDVTAGRITIDGVDVRDLPPAELYRTVGFVFQDTSVIRASVHDNVALARPEATRADVERAAEAAQIHDRIMRLPKGYATVLGEDGHLSGGEAQRLTIARALLADPPVLVLDEATAHADPESEHHVQRALSALIAGRTVLVIAHRLHTVAGADTIVVLDDGRIVQRGTHTELLATGGLYRDLWQADRVETPA